MTLKEYLEDYATAETKRLGEGIIKNEIKNIPDENIRSKALENLKRIEKGERDLRF